MKDGYHHQYRQIRWMHHYVKLRETEQQPLGNNRIEFDAAAAFDHRCFSFERTTNIDLMNRHSLSRTLLTTDNFLSLSRLPARKGL